MFSESHGFESKHRILDGHFLTSIECKNCKFGLIKTTNK